MDIKSMAKSKRSHTQHNQPRKPNIHPPKPTSSTKNPTNLTKQTKDKPKLVHQKPALPSNWDRYDDNVEEEGEFEDEIPFESVSKDGVKKAVCVEVKPKSKGADFGYLIAQAKESKQQFVISPSFGDTSDDFYQGLAPMLEVKSEGIPSWDRDDDFLLENEATSEEAPNFSLDLKALADDLAKVDLAKRLFIESDLLPPELRVVDTNEDDNQVPEKRMKSFETFEELYSIYLADEKIAEDDDAKKEDIISSSNDPSDSKATDMARVSEQDSESRLHDLGRGVNHVTGHNSMFQQGSSVSNLKANSPTHQASLPHLQDVSRPAEVTNSLDDELDNLLDASNLNKKDSPFQSVEVKDGSTDYGANRGAFSRYFQEDPSRPAFPVIPGSLDDELDNLLEETSKPTQVKIDSAIFPPSSSSSSMDPGLKLKAVDDFDSWMDSL